MELKEINMLLEKFHQLNIPDSIDCEKYNQYAIVDHSTSIEGSTLIDLETQRKPYRQENPLITT